MTVPRTRTDFVASYLVQALPNLQGAGATADELAAGYALAAQRVAAWVTHYNWPLLRDGG